MLLKVYVDHIHKADIDFLDYYENRPFKFTEKGIIYEGKFKNGKVFFTSPMLKRFWNVCRKRLKKYYGLHRQLKRYQLRSRYKILLVDSNPSKMRSTFKNKKHAE